ncbi:D-ribose pyranase [Oceanispirochaeta crateris]|uniref:D-ribose pyranase n=1 Tax=Oceanispirochaeta crateris TaxID=2518645 RepID=A0A5C1QT69_9SPIO|nr:D-ribose pyranase [Oceanispirochaeta crateris]QEN09756.1 D-ribose pyranase [Oceanispirochaeta crateris]
MKRGTLLNSEISSVIASMGHTDSLTIGDAGLPIPLHTKRIDLAVTKGVPSFIQVLSAVLDELCIEKVALAEEMRNENSEGLDDILALMTEYESKTGYKPSMTFIPHKDFKKLSADSRAIVRTGEVMPFANIILFSGVTF